MNVLFINDSTSNPNWGDRAAAIALKKMIVASGGTLSGIITELELCESRFARYSEAEPRPVAEGRSLMDWSRLLLPPVILKLREIILQRLESTKETCYIPLTMDDFDRYSDQLLRAEKNCGGLLDAIKMADVAVIHGDGCMVGNSILPRSELFLAYFIKTRFGKPVTLVNHTTDFSHPELNRMAAAVYPLMDDITYRDQTSADMCRDRWKGRYAADSAFLFEPAERGAWISHTSRPTYFDVWPDEASFNPAHPYICIGGSSIYSFNGHPTEIIEGFITLVSHLQKVYPGQVVLTASDIKDQTLFRPVAKTLRLPLVGLSTPVQQAVDIVGNAQAYVGGRWHPSIFALRGGTPVIPLSSKTFKMQALIAMSGLPTTTFDSLDLAGEKEDIGHALNGFVSQGEGLRKTLRQWAAQQSSNSWDNVAFISHWRDPHVTRENQ
jgi:polysaccharide pyruvyl transferase WcaK-like protein